MDSIVTAVPVKVVTSPVQVPSISLSASPVHTTPSLMTASCAHTSEIITDMDFVIPADGTPSTISTASSPTSGTAPGESDCLDLGKSEAMSNDCALCPKSFSSVSSL